MHMNKVGKFWAFVVHYIFCLNDLVISKEKNTARKAILCIVLWLKTSSASSKGAKTWRLQ